MTHHRQFCLSTILLLSFVAAACGEEASPYLKLAPLFADDFAKDTRGDYEVRGDVEWSENELAISSKASLGRKLKSGAWLASEVDFNLHPPKTDGGRSELSLQISFAEATDVTVSWRSERLNGEVTHRLIVADTKRGLLFLNRTLQSIRDWELNNAPGGKWRVAYRHGHFRIDRLDDASKERFDAYVAKTSFTTTKLQLKASPSGRVHLKRWTASGNKAPPKLTSEQQAERRRADTLVNKADAFFLNRNAILNSTNVKVLVANLKASSPASNTPKDLKGRLAEAERLVVESRSIRKRIYGEHHPAYAFAVSERLVWAAQAQDHPDRAERILLENVEIRRRVLGGEHPAYAQHLQPLGEFYLQNRRYDEARQTLEEYHRIWTQVWGRDHSNWVVATNALAPALERLGDYAEAERVLRLVIRTERETHGTKHRDYAVSLANLGTHYANTSQYSKAEQPFLDAIDIFKRAVLARDSFYADTLERLSWVYGKLGDQAKTENLLIELKDFNLQLRGKDDIRYASALADLAGFYSETGKHAEAENLFLEALAIAKRELGEKHSFYASMLYCVAAHHATKGDYDRTAQYMRQSLDVFKQVGTEDSRNYAINLKGLALVHRWSGQYELAEPLWVEFLENLKQHEGAEHPDSAAALAGLATLNQVRGQFKAAEQQLIEALGITTRAFGLKHPLVAGRQESLGGLYRSMQETAKARDAFRSSFDIRLSLAESTIPLLSEPQAIDWLVEHGPRREDVLSFSRGGKLVDGEEVYRAVWSTKAMISRLRSNRLPTADSPPEVKDLLTRLQVAQRQLARLATARDAGDIETWRRGAKEASEEKERLEKQLAAIAPATRRTTAIREATPQMLRKLLPDNVAIVDFVRSDRQRPADDHEARNLGTGVAVYDAFVVRGMGATDKTVWVELGDIRPIDDAIQAWRRVLSGGSMAASQESQETSTESSATRPEHILRAAVWEKLEPHLDGCDTVIILPDAALTRVPWAALPGRLPGSFLIEDYAVSTAAYGHQLYGLLSDAPVAGKRLLVAGGIRYDETPDDSAEISADERLWRATRSTAPGKQRTDWPGLEATLDESAKIASLAPGGSLKLTGSSASEDAIARNAPRARYLHLATHGFFAAPSMRSLWAIDARTESVFTHRLRTQQKRATLGGRNPLLLSGVVLAGANLPPTTDELGLPTGQDGILTAEEVTILDLRNTELVTLSACETGLGDVAAGEGVFGLQRAFHQAGARTVVASLWKVDDLATRALMVEFYRNLWQRKQGKLQALRAAQLKMIRNYDRKAGLIRGLGPEPVRIPAASGKSNQLPPYFWAAFQLSGDWR